MNSVVGYPCTLADIERAPTVFIMHYLRNVGLGPPRHCHSQCSGYVEASERRRKRINGQQTVEKGITKGSKLADEIEARNERGLVTRMVASSVAKGTSGDVPRLPRGLAESTKKAGDLAESGSK